MIKTIRYFIPLLILFCSISLHAQDIDYLEGMPSPAEVLNKIKGSGEADTYAKQAGAFMQLKGLVSMMEDHKENDALPEKAKQLISLYTAQIQPLMEKYNSFKGYKKYSWNSALINYYKSDKLTAEILEKLVSKNNKEQIIKKGEDMDLASVKSEKRSRFIGKIPAVILMILAVILFRYVVKIGDYVARRRFERTNKYGVQEFSSFEDWKKAWVKEGWSIYGAGMLYIVCILMFLMGLGWLFLL